MRGVAKLTLSSLMLCPEACSKGEVGASLSIHATPELLPWGWNLLQPPSPREAPEVHAL